MFGCQLRYGREDVFVVEHGSFLGRWIVVERSEFVIWMVLSLLYSNSLF